VKRQLSSKRGSIHPTAWTISPLIIVICVLIGILARFAVMSRGHNYDFDSYQIVVSAKHEGLTPWQTNRYNYGPIWSYFLSLFDWIATRTGIEFRLQIVGLLTIADLVIAFFLGGGGVQFDAHLRFAQNFALKPHPTTSQKNGQPLSP
jgi:hypothetical protein